MTAQEIKILLSTKVLVLQDRAKEQVLRKVIFSIADLTDSDWQKVAAAIFLIMPELKE